MSEITKKYSVCCFKLGLQCCRFLGNFSIVLVCWILHESLSQFFEKRSKNIAFFAALLSIIPSKKVNLFVLFKLPWPKAELYSRRRRIVALRSKSRILWKNTSWKFYLWKRQNITFLRNKILNYSVYNQHCTSSLSSSVGFKWDVVLIWLVFYRFVLLFLKKSTGTVDFSEFFQAFFPSEQLSC